MPRRSTLAALALTAAALMVSGPVQAAAAAAKPKAPAATPAAAPTPAEAREIADRKVVTDAIKAMGDGGYNALADHAKALMDTLDHAPASYPRMESRGADIVMRVDDASNVIAMTTERPIEVGSDPKAQTKMVFVTNVYPSAAWLLTSLANEAKLYDQAIAFADRGLSLQPEHPMLRIERAYALMQLGRPGEAADNYKPALGTPFYEVQQMEWRILRSQGVALIEAGRLDEAEAALKESLSDNPDDQTTKDELAYVANLKAGGKPAPLGQLSPSDSAPLPRQ